MSFLLLCDLGVGLHRIMIQHNTIDPENAITFSHLGIAPRLLEVIYGFNFRTPTPIQIKAIPVGIEGKDLIGIAQTGTGKTLAFGIPMIQRLAITNKRGLVILPTRELALQVNETFQKIGRSFGLRTAVLIGGASMGEQIRNLGGNPHVIIGTPGRINDHLQKKTLNLYEVAILVLDEADRMFDMGFAPQIKKVLDLMPPKRQTMLFSATMPDNILSIAKNHMQLPVQIEIARAGTAADRVEQELFIVKKEQRNRLLESILSQYKGSILVFSRTKHGARKICRAILNMNHSAAEIHSERSLEQRRRALDGFKMGKYRVLVATDIASRGIDVKNIELVINYDIPDSPDDYVHRIGRTGRAGSAGKAISFVAPDQRGKVRDIERLIRSALKISKLPDLPPEREKPTKQFAGEFMEPPRRIHKEYSGASQRGNRRRPNNNRRRQSYR